MASNLFGGGQSPSQPTMPTMPTGSNGIGNMLKLFKQFKQLMSGKDPKAAVMQLLTEGQMSQEQFSELKRWQRNLAACSSKRIPPMRARRIHIYIHI